MRDKKERRGVRGVIRGILGVWDGVMFEWKRELMEDNVSRSVGATGGDIMTKITFVMCGIANEYARS